MSSLTGFSTSLGRQMSHRGIAESSWRPASIERCRIINVNLNDWTVDCVAELAGKKYFDIQVMTPYVHYSNGEGIYTVPEIGALCWVCVPSMGRADAAFVLGYGACWDEDEESFRNGRQNLNPGDIMMSTRDENFIILRRGGVVQVGSTPICQTIFLPIRNVMKQFCENYELSTFGGELLWTTDRDDKTTEGDAPTTLTLHVKNKANEPEQAAELVIGSHADDEKLTLSLKIKESGDSGAAVQIELDMTKEGDVTWTVQKDWSLRAEADISMSAGGDIGLDAEGAGTFQSKNDMTTKSTSGAWKGEGSSTATLKAPQVITDGSTMLGSSSATSPVVKGDMLSELLVKMITMMSVAGSTPVSSGAPVSAFAAASSLASSVPGILSQKVLTT